MLRVRASKNQVVIMGIMGGTVRRRVEQSGGGWNSQVAGGTVRRRVEQSGGGWNSQEAGETVRRLIGKGKREERALQLTLRRWWE